MRTNNVVPTPADDSSVSVPPRRAKRSRMPDRPSRGLGRRAVRHRPGNRLRMEADAVVLDDHPHLVHATLNRNADSSCTRVLEHVGERLLHDPVDRALGGCGKTNGLAKELQVRTDAMAQAPIVQEGSEGLAQAEVVECGRTQVHGGPVNVASDLPCEGLQPADLPTRLRWGVAGFEQSLQALQAQRETGHGLTNQIVEFPRDPTLLVLLRLAETA